MKKKILILGMALMVAAGISACNASSKTSSSEATTTESKQADAKAEDSKQAESDKEDKKFPEFTAKTVSGEDISSDLFKDSKLTVVNVWGSWCGPCVQEIPELQKLYESMKDKDVNVIGLAQDAGTDLDAVKEIIDKNKVTYQNIVPEGATEDFVMSIMAFPTTFFVDSDRNIVGVIQGNRNLEAFTAAVEGVLEKLK
ncbi:MAG: TlpA family protein disulfide reductase [Lachnoanaerobaculum sp.]|nr:TlpA disulfide reductase family protein [uncultured Lachnoanaerobaculum sp.]MBF1261210.1 TlpA family protein disulfide reductase [Lachnoanaerobaculum sp.]